MPATTKLIEIDIDVHRAIEGKRNNFAQSENDILRVIFKLPHARPRRDSGPVQPQTQRRVTSTSDRYAYTLLGERVEKDSIIDAYTSCLLKLSSRDESFLTRLSCRPTRNRRIIARRSDALYPKSPHLADSYAKRLTGPWWIDTNLSKQQCIVRLKIACDVSNIRFGTDLALDFPERKHS